MRRHRCQHSHSTLVLLLNHAALFQDLLRIVLGKQVSALLPDMMEGQVGCIQSMRFSKFRGYPFLVP